MDPPVGHGGGGGGAGGSGGGKSRGPTLHKSAPPPDRLNWDTSAGEGMSNMVDADRHAPIVFTPAQCEELGCSGEDGYPYRRPIEPDPPWTKLGPFGVFVAFNETTVGKVVNVALLATGVAGIVRFGIGLALEEVVVGAA